MQTTLRSLIVLGRGATPEAMSAPQMGSVPLNYLRALRVLRGSTLVWQATRDARVHQDDLSTLRMERPPRRSDAVRVRFRTWSGHLRTRVGGVRARDMTPSALGRTPSALGRTGDA